MNIKNINDNSFDVTLALSSLYLWLLFGFASSLINCDIQRYVLQNPIYLYIGTFIAFFFLFTIIDNSNAIPLYTLWLKTFVVFLIFIMIIKSKYYFAIPVLILLFIDQSISYHIKYINKKELDDKNIDLYNKIRFYINISIIILVFLGFIDFTYHKKRKHNENFSFSELILSKCKIS